MIMSKSTRIYVSLILLMTFIPLQSYSQKKDKKEVGKGFGWVQIFSGTKDAKIFIDDEFIGLVPYNEPIELKTGQHTILVTKGGFTDFRDTFDVMEGETTELEIDLIGYAGIVRITSDVQDAVVLLDSKPIGNPPLEVEVPVGEHAIMMTREGYYEKIEKLLIKAGEVYDLRFSLEPLPPEVLKKMAPSDPVYKKLWFWGIVAAVAGGTAAAFFLKPGGGGLPSPNGEINLP